MEKIETRNFRVFLIPIIAAFGAFALSLIITTSIPSSLGAMITISGIITLICALFLLVYFYYFYYRLSLDVNELCKGDGQESESYLLAAVLNTVTLGLYSVYWIYKLGKRMRANAPRYGFKMYETGKDIVVLTVLSFGIIGIWVLIKNINRMSEIYNRSGLPAIDGGDSYAD